MQPRRILAQLSVCAALLLTACSLYGPPQQARAVPARTSTPAPAFRKSPCPFDVPAGAQAKCGYVTVPEDHQAPRGRKIRLAVAIFESTSGTRQPDPAIVLAGGPGEKVVQYAANILEEWGPMVGDRDLIIFDQRGVGRSQPALECPEMTRASLEQLDETNPDASAQGVYDGLVACHERLEREGRNLSAYNSVQNAADVDAIRVALGYDQVNLLGGSYGSLLAQAVMRDHPGGIRSVVVSSVLPLEKSFFIDSVSVAPGAITRLLEACAADGVCSTAYPALQDVLYEAIDRLNRDPAPITLTHPVTGERYRAMLTGDEMVGNLVLLLYSTESLAILPRAIYNVSQGDYQLMAELCSLNLVGVDAVSQGMRFSVLCAEDLVGRSPQEYLEKMQALPAPLQGRESAESQARYNPCAVCQVWDVEQVDPAAKQPLESEIPTLILEGEFDPVTPPEYGLLLGSHLPNSYCLTVPGAGHDVLWSSGCAREVVRAFLDEPTTIPNPPCLRRVPGLVFDVPGRIPVTLRPFEDGEQRFRGLEPEGWEEIGPGSLVRGRSMTDPTALIQQAGPGTAQQFLALFADQFGFDPAAEPARRARVGVLTWYFYDLDYRGYPLDLALAERQGTVYLVIMVSARDERAVLQEQLFMPALGAIAPLE